MKKIILAFCFFFLGFSSVFAGCYSNTNTVSSADSLQINSGNFYVVSGNTPNQNYVVRNAYGNDIGLMTAGVRTVSCSSGASIVAWCNAQLDKVIQFN
jgi:hypothetical protein